MLEARVTESVNDAGGVKAVFTCLHPIYLFYGWRRLNWKTLTAFKSWITSSYLSCVLFFFLHSPFSLCVRRSHPVATNQSEITHVTSSTFCPFSIFLSTTFFLFSLSALHSLMFLCPFICVCLSIPLSTLTLQIPFFPHPPFFISLPPSSPLVSWPSPPALHPSFISLSQVFCPWPPTLPVSLFPRDDLMRVTPLPLFLPFTLYLHFLSIQPSQNVPLVQSVLGLLYDKPPPTLTYSHYGRIVTTKDLR